MLLFLPRIGYSCVDLLAVEMWEKEETVAGARGKKENFFHARVSISWLMTGILTQVSGSSRSTAKKHEKFFKCLAAQSLAMTSRDGHMRHLRSCGTLRLLPAACHFPALVMGLGCVSVCVSVFVRACPCMSVHVSMCVHARVHACPCTLPAQPQPRTLRNDSQLGLIQAGLQNRHRGSSSIWLSTPFSLWS